MEKIRLETFNELKDVQLFGAYNCKKKDNTLTSNHVLIEEAIM